MNFERFGGRRFLIAQQVLVVSTALVTFGKITSGDWVTVTLGIAGVFAAGNVAQRQIQARREQPPAGELAQRSVEARRDAVKG